jgi:tetratricopeptide (TPR) repeat protein
MKRGLWLSCLGLICLGGLALRWQKSGGPLLFARPDYTLLADNLVSHRLLGENDQPGAFRSPLFPSLIALTRESWFPIHIPFPRWQALLSTAAIPAAALLALLVDSPLAGLAAALMVALDPGLIGAVPSYNIEPFFGLLVLSVCLALLCWNGRPRRPQAALVGIAVALSLLCRSTLFLLPPFLLAVFSWSTPLRPLRRGWAVLFAASCLLLIPWTLRNYRHFQAFIPFEQGAADRNLYAATLGFVENTAGYGYQDVLAGKLDDDPLASADPVQRMHDMALVSIRRHPLRYLGSTAKRFVLAFARHWLLWALAVLFLFWKRGDARPQLLAAVAFYFFAVHSPMSWEARYFEPVLPCLYALAGCAVAEALRRAAKKPEEAPMAPPRWLTPVLAIAIGALHLLCAGYLCAEAAWLRLPCRMPASPLALLRCAETRLAKGDRAAAGACLTHAGSLAGAGTDADIHARILIDQALLNGDRAPLEQAAAVSSQTVRQQAISLQSQKRFPEAARLMDALVALKTRSADALTVRGAQRVLAGQAQSAWEDLSQAVALDPENIAARVNLGALLESRGRCPEALEQYRRAVAAAEILPDDRIPGFYLALARYYRDRLEQGRGPASCTRGR